MESYFRIGLGITLLSLSALLFAQSPATKRIEQFSNHKVNVWKTIIYPSSKQVLPMHRHERDRVLVALTDGVLKIMNNRGAVHYLQLKKNQAYYLTKDIPGELHNDENVSHHTIKVLVVELN